MGNGLSSYQAYTVNSWQSGTEKHEVKWVVVVDDKSLFGHRNRCSDDILILSG